MAEPEDMILPLLREMRAEIGSRFDRVDSRLASVGRRLAALEAAQMFLTAKMSASLLTTAN